ncbi:transposase [Rhizobium leucaenae]|nr:transposase [Rhizobium leucaenae]
MRSRITSKIHALVDAEGRPVTLRLTGGQVADCTEAEALTDELGEGDILLADKGYDNNAIRANAESSGCSSRSRRSRRGAIEPGPQNL